MEYDRPRLARRYVPEGAITVAFLARDYPIAYGVVTNISEGGACIISDTSLFKNRPLKIRMSFFRQGFIDAEVRMVWSKVVDAETHYGVQFSGICASEQQQFRQILYLPTFGTPAH